MRASLLLLSLCAAAAFAADPSPQPSPQGEGEKAAPTATPATPASSSQQPPASQQSVRRSTDRLELDTTVVTGNRELPKVLYIVPWKRADIGELPAQPFNTLLDEALTPVDRDVFRREVTYYDAVSASGDRAKPASSAPAARPEK